MNTILVNKKPIKHEFLWRESKGNIVLDVNKHEIRFPKHNSKPWPKQRVFIDQLREAQTTLEANKQFTKTDHKDCLLCDKRNVSTGVYTVNNIRWENSTKHYINKHNIKPSDEFIDFIYRYNNSLKIKERVVGRINGINIIKSEKRFLKLDRNQILIIDALMRHGAEKIYIDKKEKDVYRYSEHAGLLDFNNTGLEKIIISGNTTRVDEDDTDIYLPKDMVDALEYEYIFHTHPPAPKAGGRVNDGILYEFPSINDMFHFIDHYNEGKTQGSIVLAAEGMYIIRKKVFDGKPINIDEDAFLHNMRKTMFRCQNDAIKKYGNKFTEAEFFSKISQDKSFINRVNRVANKYGMNIDFYSRIQDIQKQWIIDTVYLPVYTIELKK